MDADSPRNADGDVRCVRDPLRDGRSRHPLPCADHPRDLRARDRGLDRAARRLRRAPRARVARGRRSSSRSRSTRWSSVLQRRGIKRRGLAAGTAFLLVILVIAGHRRALHPDARRQREQVRRRGPRLRRRRHEGQGPVRLPRDEVPRRREGARADQERRREEAARAVGRGGLGDEGRGQHRRRDRHDRLPDLLHDASRAPPGSTGSTRSYLRSRSRAGERSGTTSTARSAAT